MEQTTTAAGRSRKFWTVTAGLAILLIFLYYYQPFESYVSEGITNVRAGNIIYWFAAAVGVIAFVIAHWQSFRHKILNASGEIDAGALLYDTLQISILIAVIFFAGATLQAVVILSQHLIAQGTIFDAAFGGRLATIILLVVLAVLFALLHQFVRSIRIGWRPRRPPAPNDAP